MTNEERTQALQWFENRAHCGVLPGAAKMARLAIEALTTLEPLPDQPLTCDQQQTAVPRWISVDEALPKDSFTVVMAVVYASNGHLTFNGAYQFATYDRADGWNLDDYPAEFDRITVTHWMPLPEPPEGVAVDAKLE